MNELTGVPPRASFKDRIAAMQMRGTIRTCVKNARREMNKLERQRKSINEYFDAHFKADAGGLP